MKKLLQQLAAYNTWAHREIFAVILSLQEEKQKAELASSFSSLYKTILHMWDAESIWWQRVNQQEKVVVPGNHFKGSLQELVNGLMQQSNE